MATRAQPRRPLAWVVADFLRWRREKRWRQLAEEGEDIGLTAAESRELEELEEEFGPSGLPAEARW